MSLGISVSELRRKVREHLRAKDNTVHDVSFNRSIFVALVAGIILCLGVIAFRELSGTEGLLLSLILTILSMIGSWFASRYYSDVSYDANLRTFALKAAEKVNNLSNELDRLSVFLQQELDDESTQRWSKAFSRCKCESKPRFI